MSGGTWLSQNKVRPGVYINFKSTAQQGIGLGDRGVVAIAQALSWGPVATINSIGAGDDYTPFTGYSNSSSNNRFLQEIFKGSNRTAAPRSVLLYRLAAAGSAAAVGTAEPMTVNAKYPGVRGNDIQFVVVANTDNSTFEVQTVVDQIAVDIQTVSQIEDLQPNDWVTFSGTGAPAPTAGTPLIGGADGTVSAANYDPFMLAIEPEQFDVVIYDGTDTAVQTTMIQFVKTMANNNGKRVQMVAAGLSAPDSEFVVNVRNGVLLADGTTLTPAQACWWVGGVTAGANYNQTLTYASYPSAVRAVPLMANSEIERALLDGEFVFQAEDGEVRVEQDINSLTSITAEKGKGFRKNRVFRVLAAIANDTYRQFRQSYIGVVNNNEGGRTLFRAAIIQYCLTLQAGNGIQNFSAEDVTVSPGNDLDAIVITVAVQPVDSVEKIYMTVEVAA